MKADIFSEEFKQITNKLDAIKLLSAIRGPDNDELGSYSPQTIGWKATYTAPIRRWIFTPKAYIDAGFGPAWERVPHLTSRSMVKELLVSLQADTHPIAAQHYFSHIQSALGVILRHLPPEWSVLGGAEK